MNATTHRHTLYIHACMSAYIHVHTYIHTNIHTCTCVYTYIVLIYNVPILNPDCTFPYTGRKSRFTILDDFVTQSLPYDYQSVMHYTINAYSKNDQPTIISRKSCVPNETLGSAEDPTDLDFLHLKLLYCQGMNCSFPLCFVMKKSNC